MTSARDGDVLFSRTAVDLKAAPIERSWILSGTPNARNAVVARSKDGQISTIVWDCSAGQFDWFYDFDEAIHILEGEVTIRVGSNPARTLGAGDVIFFPAGASAHWHVETYVRKIAFCRKKLPRPVAALLQVRNLLARVKRRGQPERRGDLLGGAPAV